MSNIEQPKNNSENILAEQSEKSNRPDHQVNEILDLGRENFAGKKILELGSGTQQNLIKRIKEKFPDAELVAFDYAYREPSKNLSKSSVAGQFTALPFTDKSFDFVLGSFSMPIWLSKKEDVIKSFQEVIRVLKSGGRAKLGPFETVDEAELAKKRNAAPFRSIKDDPQFYQDIIKALGDEVNISFHDFKNQIFVGNEFMASNIETGETIIIDKK